MGSLKDEMRGLREDHKPCDKAEDGECPGGSDGSAVPELESTTQGDYKPKGHIQASYSEEQDKNPISKEEVLSGGVCDKADHSDSAEVKDSTQTQQSEADKTAARKDATISDKFLADEEIQWETSKDKNTCHDREREARIESISVLVPSTPGPLDSHSPAPIGQHHMRTQVSLEVVQCRSAATSPMTPPEGSHSFFFPNSFVRSGAAGTDTNDAELQVGQQVEFCSVATSPMTPKTPSTTAFPELIGREVVQKEEKVKKTEGQSESGQQESFPATKTTAEAESELNGAFRVTSEELSEGVRSNAPRESCTARPAAGLNVSQATLEDHNQQSKQQRMASLDQDITILVTHYGNEEEEEEKAESSFYPTGPEKVKIDEYEEFKEIDSDVKMKEEKENVSAETVASDHVQETSSAKPLQDKTEESSVSACDKARISEVKDNEGACEELRDIPVTKPPVPESPAPFGCHNIRTQVSLEVVQCQSMATSPMTPPEGDQAFYFPSSLGKCGAVGALTKDAELQVGQPVEVRSVATAPMTPRTPTTTTFPEITKEASLEERRVEEEEYEKKQVVEGKEEVVKEEDKVTKEKKVEAAEEDSRERRNCKEKCEEPVQEVSWDEKGMTWEVYGAVVEVTVLGSAIQKHLEKQVKKQKQQPSMPPPPPLNPSAVPLTSEFAQGGAGTSKVQAGKRGEQDEEVSRRRRNPFRQLMENMQQPHCCSRAHSAE